MMTAYILEMLGEEEQEKLQGRILGSKNIHRIGVTIDCTYIGIWLLKRSIVAMGELTRVTTPTFPPDQWILQSIITTISFALCLHLPR